MRWSIRWRLNSVIGPYLWNVDSLDWDANYQPDKWIQHTVDQIRKRDNSTVLIHDIQRTTADNFAAFIDRVKAIGDVVFEQPVLLSARRVGRGKAAKPRRQGRSRQKSTRRAVAHG